VTDYGVAWYWNGFLTQTNEHGDLEENGCQLPKTSNPGVIHKQSHPTRLAKNNKKPESSKNLRSMLVQLTPTARSVRVNCRGEINYSVAWLFWSETSDTLEAAEKGRSRSVRVRDNKRPPAHPPSSKHIAGKRADWSEHAIAENTKAKKRVIIQSSLRYRRVRVARARRIHGACWES